MTSPIRRRNSIGQIAIMLTASVAALAATVVLGLILLRGLYQPFVSPSGSMAPTLEAGDTFLANKTAYGYGPYSLPYALGPAKGRWFGHSPERGDIAVFRLPRDPTIDYVKRIVGLPGDTIELRHGVLVINGREIPRRPIADYRGKDDATDKGAKQFEETLPSGAKYLVLDAIEDGPGDNTGPLQVPAGHYFALGDNRDNSSDSRSNSFGFVPHDNLIGRVDFIFRGSHPQAGSK